MERLVQKIEGILKEEFELVIQGKEFKTLEFDEVLMMMQTKEKKVLLIHEVQNSVFV